ncbi:galactokinase [Nocardioides pantholopis]|uniref:galactokinase n=1 Tax=Nocardioides pantholopis TaxID=2483798 RepID=UPI000FD9F441|nr:galactokinase [Nocardioides pantholopis]
MAVLEPGDPSELARRAAAGFAERYAAPPTVVGRAPGRVNLIGEHTDYNRGLVLPVALPHATYAAAAARTDGLVRIASASQAEPWDGSLDAIAPGSVPGWAGYAAGVLWALREAGYEVPGVDLHIDSTVPLGAGLSSSAALECSVAVAVAGLLGLDLDDGLREALVDAGVRAETEVVGAPTGGMDQAIAVHGEEGCALLIDFDADVHRAVPLELGGRTLLVTDTRVTHELTDGGYAGRRAECEQAARLLGVPSLRQADPEAVERIEDVVVRARARHVVTEVARVEATLAALDAGDWPAVGRCFLASHVSMRDDFEISTPELDTAVSVAVEAGALAARMTGGGFGGSSVAIVPDDRVAAVTRAIDAAFALNGYRPASHLVATPSAGAGLVEPVS